MIIKIDKNKVNIEVRIPKEILDKFTSEEIAYHVYNQLKYKLDSERKNEEKRIL